MNSCVPINLLQRYKCDITNSETLSYNVQHKYGPFFIWFVLAAHFGVCAKEKIKIEIDFRSGNGKCTFHFYPIDRQCPDHVRYDVIPVIIEGYWGPLESPSVHANVILIDHQEEVVEIFEPHSTIYQTASCYKEIIENFKITYPGYLILSPEITCPIGLQTLEHKNTCFLWTLFYFFLRIHCSHLGRIQLINSIADLHVVKPTRSILSWFQSDINPISNIIRGFGCYVKQLLDDLALGPFAHYHFQTTAKLFKHNKELVKELHKFHETLDLNNYIKLLKSNNLYTSELDNIIKTNLFLSSVL